MRLVFLGSGSFGLPTLRRLVAEHDVRLVVSQPDRPAGRSRKPTPTPIAAYAAEQGLETFKPSTPNEPDAVQRVHADEPDALVVIAYGHKLAPGLLGESFAINLHASLLPKYRGAAPINWAMINGETKTGVSVITLAQQMDAGAILASRSLMIDPRETAGELHDRLAELGPDIVSKTLADWEAESIELRPQEPGLATKAPKLKKADGIVDFNQTADAVRCRIHGLMPWPGCTAHLGEQPLKLCRVESIEKKAPYHGSPGTVLDDLTVACFRGRIRLLEVQPPGKRVMSFDEFQRGHDVAPGMRFESA